MTATALPQRRPRNRLNPVDVTHFRPQIEQAMTAFQADVSYAVQIARAAVNIGKKRRRDTTE